MPQKHVKQFYPVSDYSKNHVKQYVSVSSLFERYCLALCSTCAGVEVPADARMTFNTSMSEDDFFKWLRSRGVSEQDRKTLSGKRRYSILQ